MATRDFDQSTNDRTEKHTLDTASWSNVMVIRAEESEEQARQEDKGHKCDSNWAGDGWDCRIDDGRKIFLEEGVKYPKVDYIRHGPRTTVQWYKLNTVQEVENSVDEPQAGERQKPEHGDHASDNDEVFVQVSHGEMKNPRLVWK